jgi:hypothetical protein
MFFGAGATHRARRAATKGGGHRLIEECGLTLNQSN